MDVQESTAKGPIAWMAKNHVAANLLMIFFVVGGIFMFTKVTKEFLPDTAETTVTVHVPYPGASPAEVEQGIILSVEEAIRGLEGVKEITSRASEGSGMVTAELMESADRMKVYQDLKSEVDRITTFPEDSEKPIVFLNDRKIMVMSVAVYGNAGDTALREIGEQVRNRLLQDSEISQVELVGVRDLEIAITISQEELRRYGLTLNEVATRLKAASVEVPGGGIKSRSGEILVRVKERRDYGSEFADTPIISNADGTEVLLRDLAEIDDGLEDSDSYAEYNGKPAVMLNIFRIGDQTPQSVAGAVMKNIRQLNKDLPSGLQMAVTRDMAEVYDQRADLMKRNGIMGLILVLILLGTFLEIRLAFWVMMGIPISFLGAILLMPIMGVSLNMVTMFAFILALGIVVDDAIVVGENVYHYHQNGEKFLAAAVKGAREVGSPVGFSILTNVVAFIPLFLLPGRLGKFMAFLPMVVIAAFLISWIECLYILPAHLGHHKAKKRRGLNRRIHHLQQSFSHWFIRQVKTKYGPIIDRVLHWRYVIALFALVLFILTVLYVKSGHMGSVRPFPKVESDFAYGYVELPYGSPIEKTTEVARIMQKAAQKVVAETGCEAFCEGTFTNYGKGGTHVLDMFVYLADAEIRDEIMSTDEFVNRWRKEIGTVPGVEIMQLKSDQGGPGSRPALNVELEHNDISVLEKASEALAAELKEFPIVKDINDGFQPGKVQIDFQVKPEGKALGLTALNVARQVRSFYEGAEVLRQQRGRNEIKVKVRLPRNERESIYDLKEMIIKTPAGVDVPLVEVVTWTRGRSYTKINRREGKRTVTLTADVTPVSRVNEIVAEIDRTIMPSLMSNYPGLNYSYQGSQAEDVETAQTMAWASLLVILAIYGLLAIPFRSYSQPLIVMTSIPLGFVGAILGHLIMDYSITFIGIIGILALSGVVVNDALVLIDFANRKRDEGASPHDAVVAAGIQRFRPILLTTLTTFGGLVPMIFETSRQARFIIPMAISLGFGILFATLITLLLVPSLYMINDDFRRFMKWLSHN